MRSTTKKRLRPASTFGSAPQSNAKKGGKDKKISFFNRSASGQFTKDEVTFVLRNLATLCENGVSLPKAIGAMAEERSLEKRRDLLKTLRRRIESGDSFSNALTKIGSSFDNLTISQIRVGERSGTLPETLSQIADQRENSGKIREDITKKLAYPATLLTVGSGVVGFLLAYVVPVFEETYQSANVPLPGVTQAMITLGSIIQGYWWAIALMVVSCAFLLKQLRRNDQFAQKLDERVLKLPLVGPWLRDIALLQLMEVIGSLMEAGFTLAESLEEAADSVNNRAMKAGVNDLRRAVQQGEKFSREVERHTSLFPPMVSQLIIVGEQTGKLTRATQHIRIHLQDEVRRKSDLAIGVIEPVLTISLAFAVATILLAIYLPMFDMINTVG